MAEPSLWTVAICSVEYHRDEEDPREGSNLFTPEPEYDAHYRRFDFEETATKWQHHLNRNVVPNLPPNHTAVVFKGEPRQTVRPTDE